jgi:myo-inositol-1(or 4)-monophosphatase
MFTAEKSHGAYLNNRRLRVAARKSLKESLVTTGMPFLGHGDHEKFLAELAPVMAEVAGVRRFGSAALDLAWVAAGRFDAFWERGLSAWDIAAGLLLVREAGGVVTDLQGGAQVLETGDILAANENLQPLLMKLLRGSAKG